MLLMWDAVQQAGAAGEMTKIQTLHNLNSITLQFMVVYSYDSVLASCIAYP